MRRLLFPAISAVLLWSLVVPGASATHTVETGGYTPYHLASTDQRAANRGMTWAETFIGTGKTQQATTDEIDFLFDATDGHGADSVVIYIEVKKTQAFKDCDNEATWQEKYDCRDDETQVEEIGAGDYDDDFARLAQGIENADECDVSGQLCVIVPLAEGNGPWTIWHDYKGPIWEYWVAWDTVQEVMLAEFTIDSDLKWGYGPQLSCKGATSTGNTCETIDGHDWAGPWGDEYYKPPAAYNVTIDYVVPSSYGWNWWYPGGLMAETADMADGVSLPAIVGQTGIKDAQLPSSLELDEWATDLVTFAGQHEEIEVLVWFDQPPGSGYLYDLGTADGIGDHSSWG